MVGALPGEEEGEMVRYGEEGHEDVFGDLGAMGWLIGVIRGGGSNVPVDPARSSEQNVGVCE